MSTNMIPVGNAILGRVLNAAGEPIDHKGDLEHITRVPLYTPDAPLHTKADSTSTLMLETGIKVIDLMAPAFHGSTIGMIAGVGLGRIVVAEEIMNTLITRHQAIPIIAGMSETAYDASNLREMVRDIEAEDRVVMLFEQVTDLSSIHRQLLRTAMTIVAHFRGEGHTPLLIIDSYLATEENMADLQRFAIATGITSIVFVPMNDSGQPANNDLLNTLDVQWWFSSVRARQSLWPAIDPLASNSRLFENGSVSMEHRQVAEQVRDVLRRYYELQRITGSNTRSEEDQRLLARGERINLFLTQPFVVAEAYTDLPGVYLTIEETIKSFRDLLDGRYDTVPVQAFNFIGSIEIK